MKEFSNLRREQGKKVMPLIGPLLDCWDGLMNDLKFDSELDDLARIIERINNAMEGE